MVANRGTVLLVDDEPEARMALGGMIEAAGYEVLEANDGEEALAVVREHPLDAVVTDLRMPRLDGLGLLEVLHAERPDLPVVMVTSADDLTNAVSAIKAGAEDFLPKPVDVDALLVVLRRALERASLQTEAASLRERVRERDGSGIAGLLGVSPAMQEVYRAVRRVAPSRATVLITGESGTGKGQLARAIHAASPRASKPMVSLHCAALAESVLESELFGHERGAFTGADRRRIGRFEQAHGGTLFLDEVGEIPQSIQVKLLRVLQERTLERVGGNEPVQVDVRIIAATNRNLTRAVADGSFREDLYYRLNVVHVEMPPLRLRGSDVLQLAEFFLQRFAKENHKPIAGFTDRARTRLQNQRWTGNVRALENAIERAVVMCETQRIDVEDLPGDEAPPAMGELQIPGSTLAEAERYVITRTLEAVDGSTARAAEILDVSVRMVQYRLHEYGIERKRH